ncbi:serine hydrolase domain-containing protein [Paractinoplanes ferrugineus]|uniref:Serine hydrolase n=1 Tax=Paractinoplanes ferrugineus TaxID=113564 RepID=A0A919J1W7_9ACTN|nr:serine hydrolase domain-containing protein [Actinoplanes ferrugineus]GIE10929.1 serine hydrolase [Actinoplanes ferrugineus]
MSDELLPETRRALRHRLATAQVEARAPSIVAAVVRDGARVWAESWGSDTGTDVQYRVGSISKTFTTVLVLRLRDEGLISLTDPLGAHLPGSPAGDALIRDLLAHTAGLTSETPGPWWERTAGEHRRALTDVLAEQHRVHPAGDRFHYSNPGFALLGALVAKLRGQEWGTVLRNEILEPLGLRRTTLLPVAPHAAGWAVHPHADVLLPEPLTDTGLMAPAGQIWSTIEDLSRYAAFLLHGDDRVLSAGSVGEMRRPASAPAVGRWNWSYGLGMELFQRDERLLSGHTGSMPGFVATLWTSPDDDLAAVALANSTTGAPLPLVAAEMLDLVADREPRIPAPWTPLPSVDESLLALAGHWYWGPAEHVLKPLADGWLELTVPPAVRGVRLRPTGAGEWIGTSDYYDGERLRLGRAADGTITHFDLGSFVFTRSPYDAAAPIPGGVDRDGWQTFKS